MVDIESVMTFGDGTRGIVWMQTPVMIMEFTDDLFSTPQRTYTEKLVRIGLSKGGVHYRLEKTWT